MEKHFFTFGQNHTHRHASNCVPVTLDCDSVVQINAPDSATARAKMFDLFGRKWSMHYKEGDMDMSYFPRGVVLELTCE